jgi:FkbM family methyltransferase
VAGGGARETMIVGSSGQRLLKRTWEFVRSRTRGVRRRVAYRIYQWPLDPQLEHGAVISYSAFGEDCVALGWLRDAGIRPSDIRYLDIGASDPVVLSNTMLMYGNGAKGVLVEPDSAMVKKLRARRARDTVINAAAAFDERRTASLIRFNSSVFNTFSEAQAEHVVASSVEWGLKQSILRRVEVRLIPINDIIERYLGGIAPHFLSIDAESVDFEILKSLDLERFRPWIICIEQARPTTDFEELLRPSGYRYICQTPHNLMFVLDPLPAGGGSR